MMVLVIGGSGSGKSAYAEKLACRLAEKEGTVKYYLASMRVFDEEGKRKVESHRERRKGKGFLTIEQPVRIEDAVFQMGNHGGTVLLECVSNLAANEMFAEAKPRTAEETAERIIRGIGQLRGRAKQMVIVTNNVFEDGTIYDPAVMDYIRAMGKINRELASWADRAVEVVAGIPVSIK